MYHFLWFLRNILDLLLRYLQRQQLTLLNKYYIYLVFLNIVERWNNLVRVDIWDSYDIVRKTILSCLVAVVLQLKIYLLQESR